MNSMFEFGRVKCYSSTGGVIGTHF